MQVFHGIDGLRRVPPKAAASVGNFDGVHRGHQRILKALRDRRDDGAAAVVVVTFEPHPLTVLRPAAVPPRLTPPPVKLALLESHGVDACVILPPVPAVLNLTAEDFWRLIRDDLQPAKMVEGAEFNFGKGRAGNIRKLIEWSAGSAVRVEVAEPVSVPLLDLSVTPVSSTLIRWLLGNGRARDAAICLGRPYALVGEVVKGFQRGRTIGVPTANLKCGDQLTPLDGVYAGRCEVEGATYPAALSIGTLPTFGEAARQIEAHLVGYSGDLYGKTISVDILDWLREQRKYEGVEPLKAQIARDLRATESRAGMDASAPIGSVTYGDS